MLSKGMFKSIFSLLKDKHIEKDFFLIFKFQYSCCITILISLGYFSLILSIDMSKYKMK